MHCPYLKKGQDGLRKYECRSSRMVPEPSALVLRDFCTTHQYPRCPLYCQAIEREGEHLLNIEIRREIQRAIG